MANGFFSIFASKAPDLPLKIVFMGTPEFAVPSVEMLHAAGYSIVGVITATDKHGGRGRSTLLESAVKKRARELGLRILQPPNLKAPAFLETLRSLGADLQVVVAFRMLPEIVWNMPPRGTINLHGSLLPAYRGAAPINWAIIRGETVTGVTTFQLSHEIDTGDILLQHTMAIGPDETAGEVHDRMMVLGAETVLATVRGLEAGTLVPVPQDHTKASPAPKLTHEMCRIAFDQPAAAVHNFIRGLSPYPTAWTILDEKQLNVIRSEPGQWDASPGQIRTHGNTMLEVSCAAGSIKFLEVQLQGKRRMEITEFLRGYTIRTKVLGY